MAEFLYKLSLALAPPLVNGLLRLWFATCPLTVRDEQPMLEHARNDTGITAFWHYSFLYNFFYFRRFPAAIMVSASRDGEYIARLAKSMGHVPVRGSSNRRGVAALKEMIGLLRDQGRHGAVVADGSQGPARQAQAGVILMAARSGKPIFPLAWACRRSIVFRSWDRTVLPLPFTRIIMRHAPALHVPPNPTAEEVEALRLELEARLNRVYTAVWNEVGLPAHDGAVHQKKGARASVA